MQIPSHDRRSFIAGLASFLAGPSLSAAPTPASGIVIERDIPGRPHAGKVLAAIQPHADDIPLFAAGTVAKLIREGYTGYLIRTTNDECAGPGSVGETVLANERDNREVARVLGLKKCFDLNYRNHRMDGISELEYRARLVFLIRLLKINTVVSYDPWGQYEENPDHYVTARGVEAACWMAGMAKDYPEHFDAGLEPHSVAEKYYFARGPQIVNRVVDISSVIDAKVEANRVNTAQGPAGASGAALRKRLAAEGLELPLLGATDETANRQYIKHVVLRRDAELGREHGLAYAEAFHYIGPSTERDWIDDFVKRDARPVKK